MTMWVRAKTNVPGCVVELVRHGQILGGTRLKCCTDRFLDLRLRLVGIPPHCRTTTFAQGVESLRGRPIRRRKQSDKDKPAHTW